MLESRLSYSKQYAMSVNATVHAKNESVKNGHDPHEEEVEFSQNHLDYLEKDKSAYDDLCHDFGLVNNNNDHLLGDLPFLVELVCSNISANSANSATPMSVDPIPEFDPRLSDFCEVKVGISLSQHH